MSQGSGVRDFTVSFSNSLRKYEITKISTIITPLKSPVSLKEGGLLL